MSQRYRESYRRLDGFSCARYASIVDNELLGTVKSYAN